MCVVLNFFWRLIEVCIIFRVDEISSSRVQGAQADRTAQRYLTLNSREKRVKKNAHMRAIFSNARKKCARKKRFCRFLCWWYDRDVARWTPLYTERWEDTAHERIGCQELRKVLALQMSPEEGDAWYVPHHEVYHPHKPGKIRVVFDCSAKFHGVVTQQHVIQRTWLDKFICWSADKVSLG